MLPTAWDIARRDAAAATDVRLSARFRPDTGPRFVTRPLLTAY